jgi:cyclohexadieny/prephenate dehydrogenase
MEIDTLTIVGVGLIGGSIGLAAKRRGVARRVLGVGRQQASLDEALAVGAIDAAFLDPAAAVHQAQVSVFCTPVDQIAAQVVALAPGCAPDTLLTDAGSTKSAIVNAVDGKLPERVTFVGSHPLAGSEKKGPRFASPDLFHGRLTIITPTPRTDPGAIERTAGFWKALGARVRLMTPEAHDRALAVTSHLPHLVAAALAGVLPPELHEACATGFRDTTRVASGDPALWSAIFSHNSEALLAALDALQQRLTDFRKALTDCDRVALDSLLAQAKRTRDALGS